MQCHQRIDGYSPANLKHKRHLSTLQLFRLEPPPEMKDIENTWRQNTPLSHLNTTWEPLTKFRSDPRLLLDFP